MEIREILTYELSVEETVNNFLKQLVDYPLKITKEELVELIESKNSHLFILYGKEEESIGMLTLGIYPSPSGKKAWIEDVVVDSKFRGQGIGKKLVQHALDFAKENQVKTILLTSNPKRLAANHLYKKVGFQLKTTNLYTLGLEDT